MTIFKFITEIDNAVREVIPGDFNVKTAVMNDSEIFGFDIAIEYTDPGCILEDKNIQVACLSVVLDSDLSFRVCGNSIYPSFDSDEKLYELSEFIDVLKNKLNQERAQILFNSIIGK